MSGLTYPIPGSDARWSGLCSNCCYQSHHVSRNGFKEGGIDHCYECGHEELLRGFDFPDRGLVNNSHSHWKKYSLLPYQWHEITELEKWKILRLNAPCDVLSKEESSKQESSKTNPVAAAVPVAAVAATGTPSGETKMIPRAFWVNKSRQFISMMAMVVVCFSVFFLSIFIVCPYYVQQWVEARQQKELAAKKKMDGEIMQLISEKDTAKPARVRSTGGPVFRRLLLPDDAAMREDAVVCAEYTLNALSRRADMSKVRFDPSNNTLLVNLRDFDLSPQVWDSFFLNNDPTRIQHFLRKAWRGSNYLELLGLGDEDDFHQLAKTSRLKEDGDSSLWLAPSVGAGMVAIDRRLITYREGTAHDPFLWTSQDVAIDRHTSSKSPKDVLPVQQTMAIGCLPNGLPLYAIFGSNEHLTGTGDPNINVDMSATDGDRSLVLGLSCLRCHMGQTTRDYGKSDRAVKMAGRWTESLKAFDRATLLATGKNIEGVRKAFSRIISW